MFQKPLNNIFKFVSCLLLILPFEAAIIYFTMKGILNEERKLEYQGYLLGEASYIGTIIAIFFTLYIVPIQNIVGKYSQEFLKRVTRNKSYIISFIFLVLGLFYTLFFAWFGNSKSIAIASFILTFFETCVLAYLIITTSKVLDVRNAIHEYAEFVIKGLSFEIPWSRKENLRKYALNQILGKDIAIEMSKFEVPYEVIEELRQNMLPITNAVFLSIKEEQLEIFSAGVRAMEDVTQRYIDNRLDYRTYDDKFLTFIDEQFITMKDLAIKSTNQTILPEVIQSVKRISIKCLEARPIRSQYGDNNLINGFANLLKDICLSAEIFKETSYAPSLVCSSLGDIGVEAVKQEFPQDAVSCCINYLGQISKTMILLKDVFPANVSNMASQAILKIINYSLLSLDSMKIDRTYLIQSGFEQINQILEKFSELPADHYRASVITSPFFGPLAPNGIAQIFGRAMMTYKYKNNHSYDYILDALDRFLQDLNQTITFKIIPNEKFTVADDILNHLYEVGILLIQFQFTIEDSEYKKTALTIIKKRIFIILTNMIKGSFSKDKNFMLIDELYSKTFGLIGMMIYESKEKNRIEGFEVACDLAKEIVGFVKTIKQSNHRDQGKNKLISQIRLLGTWLFAVDPQNPLLQEIFKIISPASTQIKTSSYAHFPYQDSAYPRPTLLGSEYIPRPPITPSYTEYWEGLENYLIDDVKKKAFEEQLEIRTSKSSKN